MRLKLCFLQNIGWKREITPNFFPKTALPTGCLCVNDEGWSEYKI